MLRERKNQCGVSKNGFTEWSVDSQETLKYIHIKTKEEAAGSRCLPTQAWRTK